TCSLLCDVTRWPMSVLTTVDIAAVVVVAVGMVTVVGHRRGGRLHQAVVDAEDPLEGRAELLREPAVQDEVTGRLDGQQAVADEPEESHVIARTMHLRIEKIITRRMHLRIDEIRCVAHKEGDDDSHQHHGDFELLTRHYRSLARTVSQVVAQVARRSPDLHNKAHVQNHQHEQRDDSHEHSCRIDHDDVGVDLLVVQVHPGNGEHLLPSGQPLVRDLEVQKLRTTHDEADQGQQTDDDAGSLHLGENDWEKKTGEGRERERERERKKKTGGFLRLTGVDEEDCLFAAHVEVAVAQPVHQRADGQHTQEEQVAHGQRGQIAVGGRAHGLAAQDDHGHQDAQYAAQADDRLHHRLDEVV
ncbi:hypothetical protein EGW08_009337, partial [Elysia chlorotica]